MAKVDAYGSTAAQEALSAWGDAVAAHRKADRLVDLRQDAADRHKGYVPTNPDEDLKWLDWYTPWGELEEKHRPAEVASRTALKELIAAELK